MGAEKLGSRWGSAFSDPAKGLTFLPRHPGLECIKVKCDTAQLPRMEARYGDRVQMAGRCAYKQPVGGPVTRVSLIASRLALSPESWARSAAAGASVCHPELDCPHAAYTGAHLWKPAAASLPGGRKARPAALASEVTVDREGQDGGRKTHSQLDHHHLDGTSPGYMFPMNGPGEE